MALQKVKRMKGRRKYIIYILTALKMFSHHSVLLCIYCQGDKYICVPWIRTKWKMPLLEPFRCTFFTRFFLCGLKNGDSCNQVVRWSTISVACKPRAQDQDTFYHYRANKHFSTSQYLLQQYHFYAQVTNTEGREIMPDYDQRDLFSGGTHAHSALLQVAEGA